MTDAGPELTWRPVDVDRDLDVAFDLIARCELEAMDWTDSTRDSVLAQLSNPVAKRDEHRIVLDAGEPVGLLLVEVDDAAREVFLDAFAVGDDHGRILQPLMEHGLRVAMRVAAADPTPLPAGSDPYEVSPHVWQAMAGQVPEDLAYGAVLGSAGFRPVRRFWRMSLDLAGRSTAEPEAPAGVTVRVAVSDADRRVIHALEQDSFAEHFGSGLDEPYEQWLANLEARPGHDPERCWIASLDGTPVGLCILDHSLAEFGDDHVRRLGVVQSARGRGIGRWLLERAAAQAAAQGHRALALSVDGENTTGATALYESVGFVTGHVVDVWCYPLVGESA